MGSYTSLVKSESQFACLLIVEKAGLNGIDALTFAHRRWPDHKKLKEEGGAAQLCSGAGALLTALAEENLVEKIGEGRDARYVLTWQGRDFLANFVRDRRTQDTPPTPSPATPTVDVAARAATAELERENARLSVEIDALRFELGRLGSDLANARGALGAALDELGRAGSELREARSEAAIWRTLLATPLPPPPPNGVPQ